MFGLFKKSDKSNNSEINNVNNSKILATNGTLNPPKNLPDLAKDMFTTESPQPVKAEIAAAHARMSEPVTTVQPPKLDLNLLRQSISNVQPQATNKDVRPTIPESKTENISIDDETRKYIMNYINSLFASIQSNPHFDTQSPPVNLHAIKLVGQGLFKEIEESISKGGNINDYTGANVMDRLREYHFPLGGKESGGLLQELQYLEHFWLLARQREESAHRLSQDLESEIRYKTDVFREQQLHGMSYIDRSKQDLKFKPLDILNILKKKSSGNSASVSTSIDSNPVPSITISRSLFFVDDAAKYFYLKDGGSIKSLDELIEKLGAISKDVFEYHVNNDRNDFANWIDGVFKLHIIAGLIRNTKTANEMIQLLTMAKEKNYLY